MELKDVEASRELYYDKITETKDVRERAELYSQYKKAYKAYFVNYQLQTIFSDIKYDHSLGILKKSSIALLFSPLERNHFSFINNKMIIGINDHNDAFEPPDPAFRINEARERAKVLKDMKLIINIVDSLNLS